jgi:TPR repeat protein
MYANGLGVAQDYTEAVDWYRKAAEQDDPAGEVNLLVQCMNAGLVLNKTTPR